jgi:hypothetical protein
MELTDQLPPERRTCTACGKAKGLSRFPARGRGKSTVCRGCLAEGKAPLPRRAPEKAENDRKTPGEVPVAEVVVPPVPTIVRGQVLEFAKALRVTAHEARKRTAILIRGEQEGTLSEGCLAALGAWIEEVGAKNLDRAAAQLELLCG